MELMHKLRRIFTRKDARIEMDARYLVQKLAREEAARRAANVARLIWPRPDREEMGRVDRRARNARIIREHAELLLRRELGLPDFPTAVEIADWGIAPTPSKPPTVKDLQL